MNGEQATWTASKSVLGWPKGYWPMTVNVRFEQWTRKPSDPEVNDADRLVAVYWLDSESLMVVDDDSPTSEDDQ